MQHQVDFEVSERDTRGKNAARRLRAAGKVPGVVYGLGKDPRAISIDTKLMTRLLLSSAGQNSILNLKGGGADESAMAVDYQVDPVKNNLLHVDLRRVDLQKLVIVAVPVVTVGIAYGVKTDGGYEEMVNREVLVECLPLDIPEKIEVDVTELGIGEAVRAGDLSVSDKYTLADDSNKLLVHINATKTAEESEEEDEEATEAGAEGVEGGEENKAEEGSE